MLNKKIKNSIGFSLLEMLIILALISTFFLIIAPQFGELIRKAKESTTKGNLGVLRSSLRMYYSANEGIYPQTLQNLIPQYMDSIPSIRIGAYGHADTSFVQYDLVEDNILEINDSLSGWIYGGNLGGGDDGQIAVACIHTDTKSYFISAW